MSAADIAHASTLPAPAPIGHYEEVEEECSHCHGMAIVRTRSYDFVPCPECYGSGVVLALRDAVEGLGT